MDARSSRITGWIGLAAALWIAGGCGSGSASGFDGYLGGGSGGDPSSGGGASTGGLAPSGGSGGDPSTGGASTGGLAPSGGSGGDPSSGGTSSGGAENEVCAGEVGLPGPSGIPSELPYNTKLQDVSGDGAPDLVWSVANPAPFVVVRLGDGDGGFGPEIQSSAVDWAYGPEIGDVTGDGLPDVVLFSYNLPYIQVLVGNGDGTFAWSEPLPSSPNLQSLAAQDVNGDGRADVVSSSWSDGVEVRLQAPGGGLGDPTSYPTLFTGRVDVADLNGDGAPDLVGYCLGPADNGYHVRMLPNTGDGDFGAPVLLYDADAWEAFATVDLNDDGRTDIVKCGPDPAPISYLQQNDGTLGPPVPLSLTPCQDGFSYLDFDGDGHTDVLGSGHLRFGAGDGTFPLDWKVFVETGLVADINLDGHSDIVARGSKGVLYRLLSGPDGSLHSAVSVGEGWPVADVAAGDLGGDGVPDLAAISDAGGLLVAKGLGDGSFEGFAAVDAGAGGLVRMLDVNGDQRPDLVVLAGPTTVSALLQGPDGAFSPGVTTTLPASVHHLAALDANGDGLGDLVGVEWSPVPQAGIQLLLGQGDGQFTVTWLEPEMAYRFVVAGDVDGDGDADLVASRYGGLIQVLRGHGDGSFDAPEEILGAHHGMSLALADLDGDGALDLTTWLYFIGVVTIHNHGDGTFDWPVIVDPPPQPVSYGFEEGDHLDATDVDGDGVLDLVVDDLPVLSVCRGHGDGTFAACQQYPSCFGATRAAIADLNGDGRSDFVAPCGAYSGAAVMMSTCLP